MRTALSVFRLSSQFAFFKPSRASRTFVTMKDYVFPADPIADKDSVVSGPKYRFTVLTDKLLRYEWAEDGQFEDRASTFAVNRHFPVPKFQVKENEDGFEIITDHFHLDYDRNRFSASGLMASFSAKVTLWGAQWRYNDDDIKESRGNLGGTARTLDEVDGRCDMGQGVVSRNGYATVDDSTSMLFDGEGFVTGRRPGDRIDGYLFAFGHDYNAAVKAMYSLSGKQPLIPRYSLGNWWSRYYRYTQDGYVALMDKFRERDVPLSVAVVDMDWHLVNDDRVPHAGWTGYTWDDSLFPDPTKFGKDIHDRNLKITLNDHPHSGVHHHETSYEEMAKFMGHDTKDKTPILFDPTNPKFMEATLSILHRNIENEACDFWWLDWQQGSYSKIPGVDPLWVLNHFHFLDSSREGRRPIIFSRYGGPGSHRYPVGFSGDTLTSWASLAFQPEFTATASNIGYGWWSHDIGGHMFGTRDDELVTRWVQFGVFSPIMRLHSTNSAWASKEPWLYRPEAQKAIEEFMRFRHRMIPYLYSMNVRSAEEDEPLVQPMYWRFPELEMAYDVPNQYYFGSEMIVCPVVTPRDTRTNCGKVKAWLPPTGRFVDIFTGTVYDGDRELDLYRPLESMPILAPEGAIIPLDADLAPKNGGVNPEAFEVLVVVGQDGKATVVEHTEDDDKKSGGPSSKKGEQRESTIEYSQSSGKLTATVTGGQWSFRFLSLILPDPEAVKVSVDSKDVTKDSLLQTHAAHTSPEVPGLVIDVPGQDDKSKQYQITIELGENPQLAVIDHKPKIQDMLRDYQIEFSMKDKVWAIVEAEGKGGLGKKIGNLMSLGLDEDVRGPIEELLLADERGA